MYGRDTRSEHGRRGIPPARYVWLGLSLVFAAVEGVLILADAGVAGSPLWRPLAYQYGGFWAGLLQGWQPNYALQPTAMFATYAFVHTGWAHLLGNVLTLAWLGVQLERVYGAGGLGLIFVLSTLGGGLGFGLLSASPRPMVGASGAIMGLVAVWIAADAQEMAREGRSRARILGMVALRTLVIAALNLLGWAFQAGGLAWQTHLGGFVTAALAVALIPALRPRV